MRAIGILKHLSPFILESKDFIWKWPRVSGHLCLCWLLLNCVFSSGSVSPFLCISVEATFNPRLGIVCTRLQGTWHRLERSWGCRTVHIPREHPSKLSQTCPQLLRLHLQSSLR